MGEDAAINIQIGSKDFSGRQSNGKKSSIIPPNMDRSQERGDLSVAFEHDNER